MNINQVVAEIEQLVRGWWDLDLVHLDPKGQPVPSLLQSQPRRTCNFCQVLLASPKGQKACAQSFRQGYFQLKKDHHRQPLRGNVQGFVCHLGLQMRIGCVRQGRTWLGALLACGFLEREPSAAFMERTLRTTQRLQPAGEHGALRHVPVMNTGDLKRLGDLLRWETDALATSPPHSLPANSGPNGFGDLIVRSAPMRQLLNHLRNQGRHSAPVLLWGERGSGKLTAARTLHGNSARRLHAFIATPTLEDPLLIERSLFGDLVREGPAPLGLLERAQGGTLYVGPRALASVGIQVRLLRLIQEGTFSPAGTGEPRDADVRLILGWDGNPIESVRARLLRGDLVEALGQEPIWVPPLRERSEDLPELIALLVRKHLVNGRAEPNFSAATWAALGNYPWPGNGAELEDEIRRLVHLPPSPSIGPDWLSPTIRRSVEIENLLWQELFGHPQPLGKAVEKLERELFRQGLSRTEGNKSLLARELGISRTHLLAKLKRYGLGNG